MGRGKIYSLIKFYVWGLVESLGMMVELLEMLIDFITIVVDFLLIMIEISFSHNKKTSCRTQLVSSLMTRTGFEPVLPP